MSSQDLSLACPLCVKVSRVSLSRFSLHNASPVSPNSVPLLSLCCSVSCMSVYWSPFGFLRLECLCVFTSTTPLMRPWQVFLCLDALVSLRVSLTFPASLALCACIPLPLWCFSGGVGFLGASHPFVSWKCSTTTGQHVDPVHGSRRPLLPWDRCKTFESSTSRPAVAHIGPARPVGSGGNEIPARDAYNGGKDTYRNPDNAAPESNLEGLDFHKVMTPNSPTQEASTVAPRELDLSSHRASFSGSRCFPGGSGHPPSELHGGVGPGAFGAPPRKARRPPLP